MKPTGDGKRRILLVAEAPGEQEDEEGVQLIGRAGQYTREVLDRLDYDMDDGNKTNAVICRPPDNDIQDLHIDCCRPNLLKTLRDLEPRVVILLGASAVKSLMPTERDDDVGGIGRWVGWKIPSREHNAWICPTYHPSHILRSERNGRKDPVLERLFRQHLKAALKLEEKPITGLSLDELKKKIEIIKSPRDARLRLKDLVRKKGRLAFDFESTGIKPDRDGHRIVACSFCFEGEDTFAFLVDEGNMPYLSDVLRSARLKKIAANLKNEERWTRKIMGHSVANWWWDTMIGAHYLDNRGSISGLKFQVYVRFGIADYNRVVSLYFHSDNENGFNKIDDCPKDDLLMYNGLDSLFEFMLALVQRKEMGLDQ